MEEIKEMIHLNEEQKNTLREILYINTLKNQINSLNDELNKKEKDINQMKKNKNNIQNSEIKEIVDNYDNCNNKVILTPLVENEKERKYYK